MTAMKCPRDTNGDGDCGRRFCPACGTAPEAQKIRHHMVLALIGKVAADVWDEHPLSHHVDATSDMQVDRDLLAAIVADHFCYDEGDGSQTHPEFLDSLSWFNGYRHLQILDDLRDLSRESDPDADPDRYGRARRAPVRN